jgi:hypothetical protein
MALARYHEVNVVYLFPAGVPGAQWRPARNGTRSVPRGQYSVPVPGRREEVVPVKLKLFVGGSRGSFSKQERCK